MDDSFSFKCSSNDSNSGSVVSYDDKETKNQDIKI